jgi:hypothetical protein
MRANRKKCRKKTESMHMRGAGIDLEVEIYFTKLANETSP